MSKRQLSMRLSEKEIMVIKNTACKVWGAGVKVHLFGSRTDDNIKGGDIDLLINPGRELSTRDVVLSKANFLSQLYITLGQQKIDIIIETPEKINLSIIKTARETSIIL